MNLRTAAVGTALALFGLGAAVGIGLAANSISGDSVGLSAEPLSAGEPLAPRPATAGDAQRRAQARRRAAAPPRSGGGGASAPSGSRRRRTRLSRRPR
jgi:hypothetical protein